MNGFELSLEVPWHTQSLLPLLLLVQLLPLLGSILVQRLRHKPASGTLAFLTASLQLALVGWLWYSFDPAIVPMQFAERLKIVGPFGYHVGLDGLNLVFLQIISLLGLALVLYAWVRQLPNLGRLLSLILLANAASVSMVLTLDLFWFWLLTNLQLWTIGRLLGHWGDGPGTQAALRTFWHFMSIGQLLLLVAILMLGWHHADIINGRWSFDLLALRQINIHQGFNEILFFLFFFAFALRTPIFPLHGWLPTMLEQAGLGFAAVLLLGIKLGLYAMLRFLLPLLPETVVQWQYFIIGISILGAIYGTVLAILQSNLHRQLAYITLSQSALITLGIFTLGKSAYQGSTLLAINFGLGLASLILLMGLICERTSSQRLPRRQEMIKHAPFIGLVFFIASLSLLAIPTAPGFEALLLLLEDAIARFGALLVVFTALNNLVAASLMLWLFHQVFIAVNQTGGTRPVGTDSSADTSAEASIDTPEITLKRQVPLQTRLREFLLLLLLLASLLGLGFHPEAWLKLLDEPASEIEQLFLMPTQSAQGES